MLFYISIVLTIASLIFLVIKPRWGFLFTLIVKPIIDTTWGDVFVGIKLAYIIGVGVPVILLVHSVCGPVEERPDEVPLFKFWAVYLILNLLSMQIILYSQPLIAVGTYFKLLNGFVGFYAIQRYYRTRLHFKYFLLALIAAGLFPIGVGVYQFLGGHIWTVWDTEGLKRNIGLYHDQAALKYYLFQTMAALLLFGSYYAQKHNMKKALLALYFITCLPVLYKLYVKSGNAVFVCWILIWTGFQKKIVQLSICVMAAFLINFAMDNILFNEIYQIFHKEFGLIEGVIDHKRTFAGRWYDWIKWYDVWKDENLFLQLFGSGESGHGAHNDYILAIMRSGIVGLIAYVALLSAIAVKILTGLFRGVTPLCVIALMVFVMWSIETIGLEPSAYPSFQWFTWGLIGLSLRMDCISQFTNKSKIQKTNANAEVAPVKQGVLAKYDKPTA